MAQRARWGAWWRRFGQIATYVIGGALALALAVLLVVGVIDLRQTRIRGTFTQTDCEPVPRGGCRPVGTWVSDDGGIVLNDVFLDGWLGEDGTARAGYQPAAILGGASSGIVHVPLFSWAGPLVSGAALLFWVAYMYSKAATWGDVPALRSRRGRARRSSRARRTGRASPRRDYRRSLDEPPAPARAESAVDERHSAA